MLSPGTATLDERIAGRLTGFAGFLRANGYGVGGGDAADVLQIAARIGVLDPHVLRWSFKALLCGRRDEWRRFDELFDAWFLPPNRWQQPQRHASDSAGGTAETSAARSRSSGGDEHASRPRRAASARETTDSADFRTLMERGQLLEIEALVRRFALRLKHIRLRREARAHRGRRLDIRATIRRSIASGGTPLRLAWRNHRRVRPRLVLLIDVSRSMAPYSFLHLRLARALSAQLKDIRSFIFHTHVTAVSAPLSEPDPWRAQEKLHLIAHGWGGGTRIGDSLAQFNREHAPRCVHARTAVIIISDGYDAGEPQRLAAALAELRGRARRIVWLNPWCGHPEYSPSSQGMQAALPYIDRLSSCADLASLEAVLPEIIEALR